MTRDEVAELADVVSDELRQTEDDETIRFVLKAFPADFWPRLEEVARLGIEHKLIGSVADGKWEIRRKRCNGGALATWAAHVIRYFALKDDLWLTLANKLRSSDAEQQDYAFQFFMPLATTCFSEPPSNLVRAVNTGLRAGDSRYKEVVENWLLLVEQTDPWSKAFAADLERFTAAPPAEATAPDITDEDVPF